MEIEQINEYELTPELDREISSFLSIVFGEEFGGRSYHQQRHHIRLLARHGDVLVGHVAMCYRDIFLGAEYVSIWGLAEVGTSPEMRGCGIASRLLRSAIALARSSPAEFFVLFGDRPLYAGHGFKTQRNEYRYLSLERGEPSSVQTQKASALMVLPLGERKWDSNLTVDLMGSKF